MMRGCKAPLCFCVYKMKETKKQGEMGTGEPGIWESSAHRIVCNATIDLVSLIAVESTIFLKV